MEDGLDLVTGAFGNTGRAITARLQAGGRRVRTLTGHPPEDPRLPGGPVEALPFTFDDPDALARAFDGVDTFFHTYWMRTGDASGYETATGRATALVDAAARAGVRRIVYLSVANPALDSPYPYFRGKARVEAAIAASGVPAAIVRPALVFGGESPLLDNLAWVLRRAPVFAVAGDGRYRVRPVHLDDVTRLCVDAGATDDPTVTDAVGPDRPTYDELVTAVRHAVGSRTRIVHLPTGAVWAASRVIGGLLRDRVLTREELESTVEGLADTDGPPTGEVSVMAWIREHGAGLGTRYRRAHR